MKVKKIVDGIEVEVEETEKEEVPEEPETPPSGVNEDVPPAETPKDDVDENGVPWKNRAEEYKRKYQDTLERLSQNPTAPPPPAQEEDEWTKQQRQIARNEYNKERTADKQMARILNELEATNPYMKPYRNQIEDELSGLSAELRSHKYTVEHIASSYLGKNIDSIIKAKTAGAQRKSDNIDRGRKLAGTDVLDPTPAPSGGKVVLTPEEEAFADDRNLWDKGFKDEEIRDMFKKRKEKIEKKK